MGDSLGSIDDSVTTDPDDERRAALTLATHARDAAELARWIDMLGLNHRPVRMSRLHRKTLGGGHG